MKRWRIGAALIVLALFAAVLAWHWHQQQLAAIQAQAARATVANVAPPAASIAPVSAPEFYRDIKPILDHRCVVCHGGNDAPCQLKLDAVEGIQRGATHAAVNDSARAAAEEPTRLFIDAKTNAEWRAKKFYVVLNESETGAAINLGASILYRMLALKDEHPLPAGAVPKASGTLSKTIATAPDRKLFCPTRETIAQYEKEHPLQGMPLGLPALDKEEFATITRWLETGATVAPLPPLSAFTQKAIADWERFLNRDDLKAQLMARYLYEHLFLADLYFDGNEAHDFFKLVRSRTPPGVPIDLIATRLPFDDPGVSRVYYRLLPLRATIVAKTHLPYLLSDKRMLRLQQLFLQSDYTLSHLPAYDPAVAADPFVAFAAIPVQSRYRFLLDDTKYFVSAFIKGPAYRDGLALTVIEDRFWVMFANPDNEVVVDAEFLARESVHLPSAMQNQPLGFAHWKKYADLQAHYLAAQDVYLAQKFPAPPALTLDSIWSGDSENQSVAFTVLRHADSASAVPGFIGALPKTAWVIDYPLFERLYYLLAASFDRYGSGNQQALTKLYADFLRMEGEANFLQFLPKAQREKERLAWYQGIDINARTALYRASLYRKTAAYQRESGIRYRSKNPKREFFDGVRERMGATLATRYELANEKLSEPLQAALQKISQLRGGAAAYLPQTILLRVIIVGEADRAFTISHNVDRSNVAGLMSEKTQRRPQRDSITVIPGVIGAYPDALWVVHETDMPQLARDMAALGGANGYRALANRVAVARTNPKFWQESDWLLNTYRNLDPVEWGILDYSHYER